MQPKRQPTLDDIPLEYHDVLARNCWHGVPGKYVQIYQAIRLEQERLEQAKLRQQQLEFIKQRSTT